MSKAMKILMIQVSAWFIVGVGMCVIFSSTDTINEWGDNQTKTLLLALFFLVGFTTDFVLRLLEKSSKYGFVKDERDDFVQCKSMTIGFIILIVYIFILSMTLYMIYESDKYLPIGWLWFIGYSSIVVAHLSVGIPKLLIYRKQGF